MDSRGLVLQQKDEQPDQRLTNKLPGKKKSKVVGRSAKIVNRQAKYEMKSGIEHRLTNKEEWKSKPIPEEIKKQLDKWIFQRFTYLEKDKDGSYPHPGIGKREMLQYVMEFFLTQDQTNEWSVFFLSFKLLYLWY